MITRHTRGSVTWVDLESPTHEELDGVMREFRIDSRIEEEIIAPTPYPITIQFPEYLYLILHFPTASIEDGTKNQEIDFIVGKDFLITARYEVIDSLHNLHRVFEAEELLGSPVDGAHADALLERVFRRLYGALTSEVEQVARRLERIERDIFSGRERQTVRAISDTGRVLLRFDTALARHELPLKTFLTALEASAFFGKRFAGHAAHIEAERDHAAAIIASYRAVARELRLTNDSLLSAGQNEIMKVLTIMSFVILPLTLITGVFGMNAQHIPLVGIPYGFWYIVAILVLVAICLFSFFRYKKWL